MTNYVLYTTFLLSWILTCGYAAADDEENLPWPGNWITHPSAPATDFAVIHLRRAFQLETIPKSLRVNVSADNRYQLFVNGQRIGEGPARGDLLHWRFETFELSPYLRKGKNVIAAVAWNYGIDRPESQISYRLGFVLQPVDKAFGHLKTDRQWLTWHNQSYSPITDSRQRLKTYIVVGPQLTIDGRKFPWGWRDSEFDDTMWQPAKIIDNAGPAETDTEVYWGLRPRQIPNIVRESLPTPRIARQTPASIAKKVIKTIPPNTTVQTLFDCRKLSNFFLNLKLSGGKDATVRIEYAEALIDQAGQKGNRDAIEGRKIRGVYDVFHLDGGNERNFSTLWFRTGRYFEMTIKTKSEALEILDINREEFAYPFEQVGSFSDPSDTFKTQAIWDVGWQTARMCAQETYVDCPYYEQLQYVGDTRIQALISLYVSGDDRLMRKAIEMFDQSRISAGLTQSRFPSSARQFIPTYSLAWVEMVADYWMHRPDKAFVEQRLRGVQAVLDWYDRQRLPNGLIGDTDYWNFVDWTPQWPWNPVTRIGGEPKLKGGSSIISLQYLHALQTASKLHYAFDDDRRAKQYAAQAHTLQTAIKQLCWASDRKLYRDCVTANDFSQHANIFALLTDTVDDSMKQKVMETILNDKSLTQVSEYFRFYLIQSLYHTGNAHRYPDQLKIWAAYLDQGFTTWPERAFRTRSDCHAWSASPNYDLLSTVAGVRPGSPGFETVSIRPASIPGLQYTAVVAHPQGQIEMQRTFYGEQANYQITLPPSVGGELDLGDGNVFEMPSTGQRAFSFP